MLQPPLPQTPKPIHILKAYDNSYSKMKKEHKCKDKDNPHCPSRPGHPHRPGRPCHPHRPGRPGHLGHPGHPGLPSPLVVLVTLVFWSSWLPWSPSWLCYTPVTPCYTNFTTFPTLLHPITPHYTLFRDVKWVVFVISQQPINEIANWFTVLCVKFSIRF